MGDLNGDGKLDIADVNLLINLMLGKADVSSCHTDPDVNKDKQVDVADINLLINTLLGKR